MRHPPRKISLLFLVSFLLFSYVPFAQSRTIALVYDDSGSMANYARWCYANYALQALVGLMTPEDTLFVVRMSRATRADRVSTRNIYQYISKIQKERHPKDKTPTPYQAIETAMKAIKSMGDTDNWLLVITDGNFSHEPSYEVIKNEIIDFTEKTGARSIFLLIGENPAEVNDLASQPGVSLWKEYGQAVVLKSLGRDQIIEKMRHICAMVTSRTGAEKGPKIVSWNNKSITIFTPFPLYRLTVLEQDTSRKALASVKTAGIGKLKLHPGRSITISTPRRAPKNTALYGKIVHITCPENDRIIPSGNITITFDKPLEPDQVRFLPQVAARLDVYVRKEKQGKLLPASGTYTLCKGKTLEVIAKLLAANGKNLLDSLKKYPDAMKSINVFCVFGNQRFPLSLDGKGDSFITDLPVSSNYEKVSVVAEFPGYFYYKSNIFAIRGVECGKMAVKVIQEGKEIRPFGGIYPVCSEKKVRIEATLLDSNGKNILKSTPGNAGINTSKIVIEKRGRLKHSLMYDAGTGIIYSEINIHPRQEHFTLKAGLSDYNFPPQELILDGSFCAHVDAKFRRADGKIVNPSHGSCKFCLGTKNEVEAKLLTAKNKNFLEKIAKLGIRPAMVHVAVVNSNTGTSTPLSINSGDSEFYGPLRLEKGKQQIQVKAEIPGFPPVDPASFLVDAIMCKIGILPVKPWSAKVTGLKSAHPIKIVPTIGGMLISRDNFSSWTLKPSSDSRVRFKILKDKNCWYLKIMPYYLVGITSTGKIPVTLNISSPHGSLRKEITINVVNVGWWEKWKTFIVTLSTLIFLLWWTVGIIKKPRFARESYIGWERESPSGHRKRRYPLAGSFFKRWLIPYIPEEKRVEELTFKAGTSSHHIVLPRKFQTEEMTLGGQSVTPGKKEIRILLNQTLTISRKNRTKIKYTYRK